MLSAHNVSFRVGPKVLLHDASIDCPAGRFTVLMGPNGAGKTTLLRLLAGLYAPSEGNVLLNRRPLASYPAAELARVRAVLSQETQLVFPLSVQEVVLMGRYPHFRQAPNAYDHVIVQQALEALGMHAFAERDYLSLSGGEAQKVQMARVLAQLWEPLPNQPRILLLDEPVSSLDLNYQHQLLRRAHALSRAGATVVAILHDLNLALTYADQLVLLKSGSVHTTLAAPETLTAGMVQAVFEVPVQLLSNPFSDRPLVVYAPHNNLH
ncbi:heme ABC transporter ATP-binding protein [Hymenobacter busanensis]|uniref:Heme ABC transporter ATP-binding protein n=1 Tax=Hymenobacter busanensis TaxID=2607656 RepID=A0A7L4ZX64_9BACT|nr:heme ABC transporter ATP-binding protein [Hymenobacter busanensis]KAA9332226.1 heme ABC transporter ATP-binding protein [Hymenobacter busanensis]QHJ07436.1 heme ABC transporter ATP-binding protein [Hymenobacter busanensis]